MNKYKFLNDIQLNKLNTKRLLTLLRSLNKPITNIEKYGPYYGLYSEDQDPLMVKKFKRI